MAKQKVKVRDFGAAVFDILDKYADEVEGELPSIVQTSAEVGAKVIKAKAQSVNGGIKGTGKYINDITVRVYKGRLLSEATIYCPKHYQLTHLLENGHILKAHGKVYGTTRAFPHWAPGEEAAIKTLEARILKAVKK